MDNPGPSQQFLVKPNSANGQARTAPIKPAAIQIYSWREKPHGNKSTEIGPVYFALDTTTHNRTPTGWVGRIKNIFLVSFFLERNVIMYLMTSARPFHVKESL